MESWGATKRTRGRLIRATEQGSDGWLFSFWSQGVRAVQKMDLCTELWVANEWSWKWWWCWWVSLFVFLIKYSNILWNYNITYYSLLPTVSFMWMFCIPYYTFVIIPIITGASWYTLDSVLTFLPARLGSEPKAVWLQCLCSTTVPNSLWHTAMSPTSVCKARTVAIRWEELEQAKQYDRSMGAEGGACVALQGVEQKGQETALPAWSCQGLTVCPTQALDTHHGCQELFLDVKGQQHQLSYAMGKINTPLELLFYFATQKLLLSTQAKNYFLSHGGHYLSCVLTLSLF